MASTRPCGLPLNQLHPRSAVFPKPCMSLLLAYPEGLRLAPLAQKLLGDKATSPDTRRLSAMMMQEEFRKTVNRAGRGQPITLPDAGKRELQTIDAAAATRKTQELQQKRVKAQGKRLDRKFARKGPK